MFSLVVAAGLCAALPAPAFAAPKTVCTITVNSPDERESFRRHLPGDQYQIVELVERGRPDWLANACMSNVRCDTLIISGHFDGGTEFYTDRLDARESLPVDELERASCSDACPGLFSQLKDVYLFGCNTLNAGVIRSATAEVVRSLLRAGHSSADAQQVAQRLNERYGQSNRDRLRHIFHDVPVLYGFSSKAPLGRSAGPLLDRYFQAGRGNEIASGRASPSLLALFAPSSMTAVAGLTEADPHAGFRADVCQLADDRRTEVQKFEFVHAMLQRDMTEVRMFLDYLGPFVANVGSAALRTAEASAALDRIANDDATRRRFLEFAHDADDLAVQTRMIALARDLRWLSPAEERAEFVRILANRMERNAVGSAEVDLACGRGEALALQATSLALPAAAAVPGNIAHTAVLACLGNAAARPTVLQALASVREDDATVAQVYLRHRPLAEVDEVRLAAASVARMPQSDAQARALASLAPLRLSDPQSLDELARLFPRARTLSVQRAIAAVLLRSDYPSHAKIELARSLQQYRLRSPDGEDVIDALIRRLQAS